MANQPPTQSSTPSTEPIPSDVQWDPVETGQVPGKGVPAVTDELPPDVIWDEPKQPSAFHSLKAFARGFLGALAAGGGDKPEEIEYRNKLLHLDEPPRPPAKPDDRWPVTTELANVSDWALEFGGGMSGGPAGVESAGAKATLAAARATDIAREGKTVGQTSGNKLLQMIERSIARLPGSEPLVKSLRAQNQAAGEKTEDIIRGLSGGRDTSSTGAGKVVKEQLTEAAQRMKGEAGGHFDEVERLLPQNLYVGVGNYKRMLEELTTPVQGAEHSTRIQIKPRLQEYKEALEKDLKGQSLEALPYAALKKMRTSLGEEIEWGPFSTNPANGDLKRLYNALTADMMSGAAHVSPEAAAAVKKANAAYAVSKAKQEVLSRVLETHGGPEHVFASLINGTKEGATEITEVLTAVDAPSRHLLAASALRRMGLAKASAQEGVEGGTFSVETFMTNWHHMSPEARHAMFDQLPGDYAKNVNLLVDNISALKAYSRLIPNWSNTAQGYLWAGEAGYAIKALMMGDIGTATGIAAQIGGTRLVSVALMNPATVKWLAQRTSEIGVQALNMGTRGTAGITSNPPVAARKPRIRYQEPPDDQERP